MNGSEKTLGVEACPVCGGGHPVLSFWRNADFANTPSHPEWIAMCPREGEPLAVLEDLEGREKIVAVDSPGETGYGGARKGLSG